MNPPAGTAECSRFRESAGHRADTIRPPEADGAYAYTVQLVCDDFGEWQLEATFRSFAWPPERCAARRARRCRSSKKCAETSAPMPRRRGRICRVKTAVQSWLTATDREN